MLALRFATLLRAFGSSGSGGGFEVEDVDVEEGVAVAVVEDPVSPTEALVAPALRSHGLGGDGEAISPNIQLTDPSWSVKELSD